MSLDSEWLPDYDQRAQAPVSTVGRAYEGYMTVLVADDGRVFLAYDEEFHWIGNDAYDALNALCIGPPYDLERARRRFESGG
jgi:hypothetical protein